jgi:hypothetical protein
MENHKYIVTVSGMYDEPYAISSIEEIESGFIRAVPFDGRYLSAQQARSLQAALQAKYPKYKFEPVRVFWYISDDLTI